MELTNTISGDVKSKTTFGRKWVLRLRRQGAIEGGCDGGGGGAEEATSHYYALLLEDTRALSARIKDPSSAPGLLFSAN